MRPRLHKAQRVFEPQHAGEDHRRELADVEAGARRRLRQRRQAVLGPQALHRRQPRDEDRLGPFSARPQAIMPGICFDNAKISRARLVTCAEPRSTALNILPTLERHHSRPAHAKVFSPTRQAYRVTVLRQREPLSGAAAADVQQVDAQHAARDEQHLLHRRQVAHRLQHAHVRRRCAGKQECSLRWQWRRAVLHCTAVLKLSPYSRLAAQGATVAGQQLCCNDLLKERFSSLVTNGFGLMQCQF